MIPHSFQYFAPATVKKATSLLKKYGPDAKVLAGGMSLIPILKLRLASPTYIIDINRIRGLEYIRTKEGRVMIGALTRHHDIETSPLLKKTLPLLPETARWIGDPQVRNLGSIGGSLAHSDPFGDWGAAIIALRGEVHVTGPIKERILKIDEFLVDTYTSALEPQELLAEISMKIPGPRSGSAYMKLERKVGDVATVGVAVQLTLDSGEVCTYAGIGLAGVGAKNLRAERAEKTLLGNGITPQKIEEAAQAASDDSQPSSDLLRGTAEYKKEMVKVFTRRALKRALNVAVGVK